MLRARVSRTRLTPPPAGEAPEPPLQPRVKPARKATSRLRALNAGTLEGLGARRLAELLMDAAQTDPALAQSLRLVLAGTDGRSRLAAEVEKRLRTIGRSRGFVEWDKVRPLAAADPEAAVAQMRLLLSLGNDAFMARLRQEHPRKTRFWSLLDSPG